MRARIALLAYLAAIVLATTVHEIGLLALGLGLVLSEGHELIFDGQIEELLGNQDKLLAANLVHGHRRGSSRDRRLHVHDWS